MLPDIKVWWVDSHYLGGWQYGDIFLKMHIATCVSTGMLLHENDQELIIVQSESEKDDGCYQCQNGVTIPKAAIIKTKFLSESK